jgi:Ca-activated chloride channel family protein
MMSWTNHFAYPWAWLLVALVPAIWGLWRCRQRQALATAKTVAGLAGGQLVQGWRAWRKELGLVLASLFLVIAAAGPQWGHDPKQRVAFGRDLIIALDISRSMLARDRPNPENTAMLSRLQRAKIYLADWLDILERQGGYRVGMVWFAGQARLVCPLTDDYRHIRALLDLADPDFWGPAGRIAVSEHGAIGTSLRQGLEVALNAHEPQAEGFQDILLISDGDDQDAYPSEVAAQAQARKIRIHVLGVGRPEPPSYVPGLTPGEFLYQDGKIVETRRRDELLQALTASTGGEYVPEELASQPVVRWWVRTYSREPKRAWSPLGSPQPRQRSELFFIAAILFLLFTLA